MILALKGKRLFIAHRVVAGHAMCYVPNLKFGSGPWITSPSILPKCTSYLDHPLEQNWKLCSCSQRKLTIELNWNWPCWIIFLHPIWKKETPVDTRSIIRNFILLCKKSFQLLELVISKSSYINFIIVLRFSFWILSKLRKLFLLIAQVVKM